MVTIDPVYLLTLLNTPRIGRKTVQRLLTLAESTPTCLQDLSDVLRQARAVHRRIPVLELEDLQVACSRAEEILGKAAELSIEVLGHHSPRFPWRLRTIPDPPVVLYGRGNLDCLAGDAAVAVVGTREPTSRGRSIAERLGSVLAHRKLVVVSGLALGCDTAAHIGCVQAEGQSVAVLAHGLDMVHPRQNAELAERILQADGCLLSEYPPGTQPLPGQFVDRDRLQTGVSSGVIVVETDTQGGTMHTVRFCLEQGRPLGCVAPSDGGAIPRQQRGNRELIADGRATALASMEDLEEFVSRILKADSAQTPSPAEAACRNAAGTRSYNSLPLFELHEA